MPLVITLKQLVEKLLRHACNEEVGGQTLVQRYSVKEARDQDLKVFSVLYQGQEEVSQQERFPAVVLSVLQT